MRLQRRVTRVLGAFVALVVVATGAVYLLSELRLRHRYEISVRGIPPAVDSAAIARGGFLAQDLDCNGCHGDDYAGAVSFEAFGVGEVVAPNLTGEDLTAEQWERAIRFGVKRNGQGMIGMPSRAYYFLGDAEISALTGYFASLAPQPDSLRQTSLGPLGRIGLVLRWFDVEPELVDRSIPQKVSEADPPEVYGKYVGMTTCGSCHGTGRGYAGDGSFHRVPGSYSDDQLFQFLRAASRAMRWIHRFTDVGGWR